MNEIGWPQGGMFSILLSMWGYSFHEKDGRIVAQRLERRVGPALMFHICELWDHSTEWFCPQIFIIREIQVALLSPNRGTPSISNRVLGMHHRLDWCKLGGRDWNTLCVVHCSADHGLTVQDFTSIGIGGDRIHNFQTTLRKNPRLSSMQKIKVICSSSNTVLHHNQIPAPNTLGISFRRSCQRAPSHYERPSYPFSDEAGAPWPQSLHSLMSTAIYQFPSFSQYPNASS